MELIIRSSELVSSANLVRACIAASPVKSENMTKIAAQYDDIIDSINERLSRSMDDRIDNPDIVGYLVDNLNDKYGDDTGHVSVQFIADPCGTDLHLSMVFDEATMVKVMDIMSEEVEGISGVLITIYGAIRMLSYSFKRMGNRIKDVLKN